MFSLAGGSLVDVKVGSGDAMGVFWRTLDQATPPEARDRVRAVFISSLAQYGLDLPTDLAIQVDASLGVLGDGEPATEGEPGPFRM